MNRWDFYKKILTKKINKDAKILVIGANIFELDMYIQMDYKNITFGAYDEETLQSFHKIANSEDIKFISIDIRNIKSQNFDYVITSGTHHHVDVPHQAILSMYNFAKLGVLIFEGNDSLIMRSAVKLKFSEEYEHSSLENTKGGLLETGILNYIYRCTEREIEKLLKSYKPNLKHKITFEYYLDVMNKALERNIFKNIIKKILGIILLFLNMIFPNQGNCMSIFIDKKKSTNL